MPSTSLPSLSVDASTPSAGGIGGSARRASLAAGTKSPPPAALRVAPASPLDEPMALASSSAAAAAAASVAAWPKTAIPGGAASKQRKRWELPHGSGGELVLPVTGMSPASTCGGRTPSRADVLTAPSPSPSSSRGLGVGLARRARDLAVEDVGGSGEEEEEEEEEESPPMAQDEEGEWTEEGGGGVDGRGRGG